MKKVLKIEIFSLIFAIILSRGIIFDFKNYSALAYAVSPSEIVMEVSSGRVLLGENYNEERSMASTTKIATAITVIENADLSSEVKITRESVGVEGSSIYLREGESLTVEGLLYGLMLRSGNDAATALAIHTAGSVEAFSEMMNETAAKVGAAHTHFSNPHGLTAENHYTTAYDLALITAYALKNPVFSEIVSTKQITVENSEGEKRYFKNKNKMLWEYEGADGVKTGFTENAGRCLTSSATRNGMRLVCVVLGCPPMFERSKELLDEAFAKFSMQTVLRAGEVIGKLKCVDPLSGKDEGCEVGANETVKLPLSDGENPRTEIQAPEEISFLASRGDVVGKINVYAENSLLYSTDLYIIEKENFYTFRRALKGVLKKW